MGRDFFQILPSELTTNILSRLPFRSVAISKCVCKSWLNLLNSDYGKIKPPPALVCFKRNPPHCTIFEIEDKDEADYESHDLHYIPLTDFDIPFRISATECTTANGLLLLYSYTNDPVNPVYICNPLTREHILLCPPKEYTSIKCFTYFEFGVSEISGQYKVVCLGGIFESMSVHVYTLGTRSWRTVETGAASGFEFRWDGRAVCNGNIHWTVDDWVRPFYRICGFDIETECFSIFSPPPALHVGGVEELNLELTVFRDCLCICYTRDYEINIWLMKEYRVEESWTIEYKLSTIDLNNNVNWLYPIKVFKDGGILMGRYNVLIYYSNKTRTTQQVGIFNDADAWEYYFTFPNIFTPVLFSLQSFALENVISF
ncbi:F-box protein At3g07870-like [Salvia splendens]|uniref:F-box protein At3g07870-like n=1 Tax=Salvia splendens TaxID=180675 RepID=UPI001C27FB5F|nr:F-box protein At3g07870-like [Salvia splendens]